MSQLGVLTPPSPSRIAAYPWINRPFNSSVELFLVPDDSPQDLLANYRTLLTGPTIHDVPSSGLLFDAVTVPTWFAGVHDSWADGSDVLRGQTGIDTLIKPVNQLSSYREPGRVNLNTVTTPQVWHSVIAGPLEVEDLNGDGNVHDDFDGDEINDEDLPTDYTNPAATPNGADDCTFAEFGNGALPVGTTLGLLELAGRRGVIPAGPSIFDTLATYRQAVDANLNPLHKIYTASRLANTATVRSNVFAIWVTLRESISGDPDSVKYHRAFYILDRSIPVGFESGEDHNVRDVIRLRRIIE